MLGHSEACERNKNPILRVLTEAFARSTEVLEIGSGTGQHAVFFAAHLPHLVWQPSDIREHLPGLRERIALEAPANVRSPIELDVRDPTWPVTRVDAVFSANTLHILHWEDVESFFRGIGTVLQPGGTLCVYGPFRYSGRYTSDSNAAFDRLLRDRDPASGIRDFESVDALAREQGLELQADHAMPANNQTLHWRKQAQPTNE